MAFVALVLIVDRASAATGNRSDRGAWSAACNRANSRAAGRTDTYSLDGSANPMPAVISVINHVGNYRVMG
jgi:hypothetical protein